MIRSLIPLLAFAAITGSALASGDPMDPTDLNRPDTFRSAAPRLPPPTTAVWSEVPTVNPSDVGRLLAKVGTMTAAHTSSWHRSDLLELQKEVSRQTASFRDAYRASAGVDPKKVDDDVLFKQVIEDKPHADPKHLQAIVRELETIDSLISRMVIAQSIPSSGFASYRVLADRSADVSGVAEQAQRHLLAYASNLAAPTQELRRLLTLDAPAH